MSARCPRCGGSDTLQITPGLYECRSATPVGVIPPGGVGNPGYAEKVVVGLCGHQFQVAVAAAVDHCGCGRQAIGRCRDCDSPLCGIHGTTRGDLLCANCAAARVDAERQRNEARAQEADMERAENLESGDARKIAEGAAAIEQLVDRTEAARAWAAYLESAHPSPTHDIVTISPASGRRPPAEATRVPVWCFSRIQTSMRADGRTNVREYYFVDADGDAGRAWPLEHLHDRDTPWDAYAVRPGQRLLFAPSGSLRERLTKSAFSLTTFDNVFRGGGRRRPAPAVLLISLICESAGVAPRREFLSFDWHSAEQLAS